MREANANPPMRCESRVASSEQRRRMTHEHGGPIFYIFFLLLAIKRHLQTRPPETHTPRTDAPSGAEARLANTGGAPVATLFPVVVQAFQN
jgi:hypothetical protein